MDTNLHIGGFYYHYKHDPEKGFNDHAYKIINIGHHTEIEGLEESKMVIYVPLYESAGVYNAGKHYDVRPYKMFMESVTKEGHTFPRFQEITDTELIEKLKEKYLELYGQ